MPKATDTDLDFNNPQETDDDVTEPGAQHGVNHTRRPEVTDAQKGQGAKTRARNKEIAQGKPFKR
jgi:hypothetical protein